jgi:hypothetical protein
MSEKSGKRGPKPRHPGTGWVVFEVSPAAYQHLERLIHRSGLGRDVDEVAQSLFKIEVQESMKDPKRHGSHPDNWYVEVKKDDEAEPEA